MNVVMNNKFYAKKFWFKLTTHVEIKKNIHKCYFF